MQFFFLKITFIHKGISGSVKILHIPNSDFQKPIFRRERCYREEGGLEAIGGENPMLATRRNVGDAEIVVGET